MNFEFDLRIVESPKFELVIANCDDFIVVFICSALL